MGRRIKIQNKLFPIKFFGYSLIFYGMIEINISCCTSTEFNVFANYWYYGHGQRKAVQFNKYHGKA